MNVEVRKPVGCPGSTWCLEGKAPEHQQRAAVAGGSEGSLRTKG